jgi:hypothetical protein
MTRRIINFRDRSIGNPSKAFFFKITAHTAYVQTSVVLLVSVAMLFSEE